MATFKVSYVVVENGNPGAIMNQNTMPEKGERVRIGDEMFEILEVLEIIPPRGDFRFIHVTCRAVKKKID